MFAPPTQCRNYVIVRSTRDADHTKSQDSVRRRDLPIDEGGRPITKDLVENLGTDQ